MPTSSIILLLERVSVGNGEQSSMAMRKTVADCKKKFDDLAKRRELATRNALIDAICKAATDGSLSADSFRQQISAGRFNSDYLESVARFCGFDWKADQFINGTAEEFAAYLDEASTRRFDLRLLPTRGAEPWSRDMNLASLEIGVGQWAAGQAMPVFVTLICRPGPMGEIDVAVKRGMLEITPLIMGKAVKGGGVKRIASPQMPRLETDAFGVMVDSDKNKVYFGTRAVGFTVAWDVKAEKENSENGYIGKPNLPDDFCQVKNVAHGDSLKASFRVYIKDLEPRTDEAKEAAKSEARQGPSTAFAPVGDDKLDAWTRSLILKRLAEREQFGEGVSEVELCRDEVHLDAPEVSAQTRKNHHDA